MRVMFEADVGLCGGVLLSNKKFYASSLPSLMSCMLLGCWPKSLWLRTEGSNHILLDPAFSLRAVLKLFSFKVRAWMYKASLRVRIMRVS